jgi:hypothetical protein
MSSYRPYLDFLRCNELCTRVARLDPLDETARSSEAKSEVDPERATAGAAF